MFSSQHRLSKNTANYKRYSCGICRRIYSTSTADELNQKDEHLPCTSCEKPQSDLRKDEQISPDPNSDCDSRTCNFNSANMKAQHLTRPAASSNRFPSSQPTHLLRIQPTGVLPCPPFSYQTFCKRFPNCKSVCVPCLPTLARCTAHLYPNSTTDELYKSPSSSLVNN
jgi:hypothetical protein